MTVRLFPVMQVYGGNLLYPADQAKAVFPRFREWAADLPDEMTASVLIMNYPDSLDVPDPARGQSFAVVRGCHAGDPAAGSALIDSWRAWQTPALDVFGVMPSNPEPLVSKSVTNSPYRSAVVTIASCIRLATKRRGGTTRSRVRSGTSPHLILRSTLATRQSPSTPTKSLSRPSAGIHTKSI